MIISILLRLDGQSKNGFPKYEHRLQYFALAWSMMSTNINPVKDELRIYADEGGKKFATNVLQVPDKSISTEEVMQISPEVSDSVMKIILAGGCSNGLPDRFLIIGDDTIVDDFDKLRNKSFIVMTSSYMDKARGDGRIDDAMSGVSKWLDTGSITKYMNCSVIGGVPSPLWINVSNSLLNREEYTVGMNEYETSLFVSQYMCRMTEINEFSADSHVIRIPLSLRGNYEKDYMPNVRRRLSLTYHDVNLRLENYLREEKIFD